MKNLDTYLKVSSPSTFIALSALIVLSGMVIVEAEISDNRHLMPGMTAIIKL